MRFLRNAWYVAPRGDEIKPGALVQRTILGESVLLYRRQDRTAVAIGNRFPHRFAPLHLGRLKDDVVECGYSTHSCAGCWSMHTPARTNP